MILAQIRSVGESSRCYSFSSWKKCHTYHLSVNRYHLRVMNTNKQNNDMVFFLFFLICLFLLFITQLSFLSPLPFPFFVFFPFSHNSLFLSSYSHLYSFLSLFSPFLSSYLFLAFLLLLLPFFQSLRVFSLIHDYQIGTFCFHHSESQTSKLFHCLLIFKTVKKFADNICLYV